MAVPVKLDIHSERGKASRKQEEEAALLFEAHFPDVSYCHTDKDRPAEYDAMLIKGGVIVSVVAMRCCTEYDWATFRTKFKNELLISFHKLLNGVEAARASWASFTVMIYFPKEGVLLSRKVWDPKDGFDVEFRVKHSETQKSSSGPEKIWRDNAYVPMGRAAILRRHVEIKPTDEAAA